MGSKIEDEIDRLSTLPDHILVHILSLLPILDAVRTMLIKRFGTLWTTLPNLDFDDEAFDMWNYRSPDDKHSNNNDDDDNGDEDDDLASSSLNWALILFVRNVLIKHTNPKLVKFRVYIGGTYFSDIEERNLENEFDSWIDFALKKQVENLEFYVGMVEPCEPLYKLPQAEFVCDSLIELKLEFLEMKLQKRVSMRSLRVLRLIRVDISNDVFKEIIRGCPLLHELELYNCADMTELTFDAPNIERLDLDTTEGYDFGRVVEISCPNLKSFNFIGFVDCVDVQNLSSIVEVRFDLRSRHSEWKEFQPFMTALTAFLSAKVVSFSCEFVTVLFYCMLKHHSQTLTDWKHMKLSIWLTEKHIPGLCRVLTNSPCLEELEIDAADWHRDFLVTIESELGIGSLDEENYCWRALKRIKIRNVSMCLYPVLIRLVEILLRNAPVLDEFVICYKLSEQSVYESVLMLEQWAEFSEKLPTFPKASQHVRFSLL